MLRLFCWDCFTKATKLIALVQSLSTFDQKFEIAPSYIIPNLSTLSGIEET